MAKLRVEVVTGEREVLVQDDVDMVVAPGIEGQLGILPEHAALITTLVSGELRIARGGAEDALAISGGFLEIADDRVIVLADAAEHAEEIDLARAEEARRRAARPRRAYDDPAHPEVVVRLSYRGLRLAEEIPHWAGRVGRLDDDTWELRFRCPPGELAYYAREVHALGPTAEALAPPELRARVFAIATATAAIYAPNDRTPPER